VTPRAVLLDRDGTLVEDVPYNGDPAAVRVLPGVADGLGRLRAAGLRLALVSNQSGIARGLLSAAQVDAVNHRLEELVGPLDAVLYCPPGPDDECACRKPRPGMVLEAARRLGVEVADCIVIGDIGADVDAAAAAGARGILVPSPATRAEEVAHAQEVVADFGRAVARILEGGA
jgi:D-glycero-D-manno-heptose 1,7-bisphosphate phosphatase